MFANPDKIYIIVFVSFCPLQLFALLGFLVSAVLISAAASEVVSLLHMLGVVLSLSNTVLGLTLLAWGNSIGGDTSEISLFQKYMLVLKICNVNYMHIPFFQTVFQTSPLHDRVTPGWPYLPALEASFSVSLFPWECICQNILYCLSYGYKKQWLSESTLTKHFHQTCCSEWVWDVWCRWFTHTQKCR